MTAIEVDDLPFCVQCGKPVERAFLEPHQNLAAFTYTFVCHGETERAMISCEEFMSATPFEGKLVFKEGA
jgi:hypothetical protein